MGLQTVCTHIMESGTKDRVNFTSAVTTQLPLNNQNIKRTDNTRSVLCQVCGGHSMSCASTSSYDKKAPSFVPELFLKLPGMAVLTTEETEYDKNLCVTDVAVTVKHG